MLILLSPYMLTIPQQITIVMRRRVQILMGNKLNTGLMLLCVKMLCFSPSLLMILSYTAPLSSKRSSWVLSS